MKKLATIYPIAPGSRVKITCPKESDFDYIEGTVTSVCIDVENRVTYRVVWWNGNSRCTEWLEACELLTQDGLDARQPVGFQGRSNGN